MLERAATCRQARLLDRGSPRRACLPLAVTGAEMGSRGRRAASVGRKRGLFEPGHEFLEALEQASGNRGTRRNDVDVVRDRQSCQQVEIGGPESCGVDGPLANRHDDMSSGRPAAPKSGSRTQSVLVDGFADPAGATRTRGTPPQENASGEANARRRGRCRHRARRSRAIKTLEDVDRPTATPQLVVKRQHLGPATPPANGTARGPRSGSVAGRRRSSAPRAPGRRDAAAATAAAPCSASYQPVRVTILGGRNAARS